MKNVLERELEKINREQTYFTVENLASDVPFLNKIKDYERQLKEILKKVQH